MATTMAFRFDETIDDRKYRILVSQVRKDTWRAQVVTAYGGPTAVMPFYGSTPDLARTELTSWLTRVHKSARSTAS
jgi:hypothetical protein